MDTASPSRTGEISLFPPAPFLKDEYDIAVTILRYNSFDIRR